MTGGPSSVTARTLREAFDAAFAAPLPEPAPSGEVLLILQAGGESLAVRRGEVTGFLRAAGIARAPGRSPAFVGLAAVRGEVFPVWNLADLMGRGRPADAGDGWLVLAGSGDSSCAFVVEDFDQMFLAPAEALAGPQKTGGASALVKGAVQWNARLVPILDVPAALRRISTFLHRHPISTP
jgi:chemotaxis signal transduction protein